MKSYTLLILAGTIFFEFALSESALAAKNNEAGVMIVLKRLKVTLPDEGDRNETTI